MNPDRLTVRLKEPSVFGGPLMSPSLADFRFHFLERELAWTRYGTTPRMEYYVNRAGAYPYTYGRGEFARTYQPQPSNAVIDEIWEEAENFAGVQFDVCFLNRYVNQSDHLGWHSDNSPEMDDARPIATVSLGAEREIWFRKIPAGDAGLVVNGNEWEVLGYPKASAIVKLRLPHGSILCMGPGVQDTHQHRIPKSSAACTDRISLTFRGYVPPVPGASS